MEKKKQWPWPPEHGEVTQSGKHAGNRYCEYHERHHGAYYPCQHYPKRVLAEIARWESAMRPDEIVRQKRRWWYAFTAPKQAAEDPPPQSRVKK